jgi:hypothetical protein
MPAGIYNTIIEQGATWKRTITWRDENSALVDVTGYTAVLTVSDSYGGTALVTLTESSGIVVGGAAGTFACTITAAVTAGLAAGERYWELVVTDAAGDGTVTRLLKGTALVDPEVAA